MPCGVGCGQSRCILILISGGTSTVQDQRRRRLSLLEGQWTCGVERELRSALSGRGSLSAAHALATNAFTASGSWEEHGAPDAPVVCLMHRRFQAVFEANDSGCIAELHGDFIW